MTLIKWQPKPMNVIDDMDTMIHSFFNTDWNFPVRDTRNWSPAVDVKETDNSFVLTTDIPGLTKKDIKVNVANGKLSISGERTYETDQENDNYHYRERRFGTFDRSFKLPDTVDEEKISASFKNGILNVALPKNANILPKEREIKVS
jgi:HSP20 family protein